MAERVQKFNEERTFGVEIEFLGDRARVAALMNAKGVRAEVQEYNHRVSSGWKLVTDASCGYELVSPILKGREGLRQLKIACDSLQESGAKVDVRCGLHVHHDINDFGIKQIANIFAIYIKLEKAIDTLLPNSRRENNNRYCASLYKYSNPQAILNKLKSVNTIEELGNIWNTRYLKVNYQSYIKYGTIEFRQHSGTTEYDKMYLWILFTQQIVEASKTAVQKTYEEKYDNLQSLRNILRLIPAKGASEEIAEMFKRYRVRAKQLAA